MLRPAHAYAALADDARSGLWLVLRRPLFLALIQGITISMVATHSVAAASVLAIALCWTLALAVQMLAAAALVASAPQRRVSTARAIDLLFMGHAPWTLWLLAWTVPMTWTYTVSGLPWIAVLTMVIPAALTARIVAAFARQVLRLEPRQARLRVAAHQGFIWLLLVLFLATAVQLWPRVIGYLGW
jgi:hypothetical protein